LVSLRSWLVPMVSMLVTVSKAIAHGGRIWYSSGLNPIRCPNWHALCIYISLDETNTLSK
jgi:hypothetical protein